MPLLTFSVFWIHTYAFSVSYSVFSIQWPWHNKWHREIDKLFIYSPLKLIWETTINFYIVTFFPPSPLHNWRTYKYIKTVCEYQCCKIRRANFDWFARHLIANTQMKILLSFFFSNNNSVRYFISACRSSLTIAPIKMQLLQSECTRITDKKIRFGYSFLVLRLFFFVYWSLFAQYPNTFAYVDDKRCDVKHNHSVWFWKHFTLLYVNSKYLACIIIINDWRFYYFP